jgi:uncharacterized protein YecT (DUF1311 family)
MKFTIVGLMFCTLSVCTLSPAHQNAIDPCPNKKLSSAEMEVCYSAAQKRVNIQADALANKIATAFARNASDDESRNEVVPAELERKGARSVKQSQIAWRHYRNSYCNAVMYRYETGSAAWTGHESCMFQMGQERIRKLRSDFADFSDDGS